MNFFPKHLFDTDAAGNRLESLCNSFIWSGISLIAVFQIGLIFFRSSNAATESAVFYPLTALSFVGLGCIICGSYMWRAIYGLFPNVTLRRDRARGKQIDPRSE